jgi:Tol biopolymer transport system component
MDLWRQRIGSNGEPDGDAVRITQGADVRNASFSHDGARLSYSRGGRVTNVVRLPILDDRPATWNDAQQLTFERAYIEFVDVSPDGRWLAISSDRRGNPDLWTMPAEGGAMTQLTSDPTPDWNPRWSPDGKQILFYAFRGGTRDIWMMPSGGGEARQLTSRQGREWFPAWSPDGRDVVFQTEGNLDSIGPIMSMPAAGGEPRQLTTGVQPEWSPDGSWLAFRRRADLYRLDKGGHEPSLIARGPTAINQLRFPRDGRALFYSTAGAAEGDDIWRYSFDDRKTTRMTSLKGRRGALSYYFAVDSKNLYITWSEDDGDIWIMDAASPSSR